LKIREHHTNNIEVTLHLSKTRMRNYQINVFVSFSEIPLTILALTPRRSVNVLSNVIYGSTSRK